MIVLEEKAREFLVDHFGIAKTGDVVELCALFRSLITEAKQADPWARCASCIAKQEERCPHVYRCPICNRCHSCHYGK